jgi:hypothetical protein
MFKIEQISTPIQGETASRTQVSALEEVHLCKLNRFPFFRTDSTGKAHTTQFASFAIQQLLRNGMKLNSLDMRISMPAVEFAWMKSIGIDSRQTNGIPLVARHSSTSLISHSQRLPDICDPWVVPGF